MKVIFVDRDGTILVEPLDQQIDSLAKVRFVEGAIVGLRTLQNLGWTLVLVTNQDGLGTKSFPTDAFEGPQAMMLETLASAGVHFADILICPHLPAANCLCRKPRLGLLQTYLAEGFDRVQSAVIGDRETDVELAEGLGIRAFRLGEQLSWEAVVSALTTTPRTATVIRRTKETSIELSVNLDAARAPEIMTGLPFFDHMLEQIAQHAGIGLSVRTDGDWQVDDHHAVEDTALALGEALRKALGDKFGIQRYGFVLPMDESRADCALDLSGRAFCRFEAPFTREQVGGLATEMVPHFFRSLADGLRASLHLSVSGDNNHHLVEASFKAFGRCLGQAVAKRESVGIPSSKGVL